MFHFDLVKVKEQIKELEAKTMEQNFWDDPQNSQKVLQELKGLKDKVESYKTLKNKYEDVETMIEMAYEEEDDDLVAEVKDLLKDFIAYYEDLRIATLLSGEYDKNNAILTLHAGAGGTEACDWVEMLFRMYTRWAEKRGFKYEVLDYLAGEEAGIKSVTMQINGENAYGYAKAEKGVHRLVRISPFDSSGRRHTSFASLDVMPEITDDIDIDIKDDEIRIDTYRASGAGGQHVNKTDSAIRITHLPTNTVVQCQNERSQRQNKERAMRMLMAKLYEMKRIEQMSKMDEVRGEVKEIGWGSQIRSYVMHPYRMVKDHRTNVDMGNVNAVMDGDIDSFINAYLIWLNQR